MVIYGQIWVKICPQHTFLRLHGGSLKCVQLNLLHYCLKIVITPCNLFSFLMYANYIIN